MSCHECLLSFHVEHPRIQDKFLNITKHGVIVRLYMGKRNLIKPRLAREGPGFTYSCTPKRCVHGQCPLPGASWCQDYAEKPHLHTPCYLPFSITTYESILLTGGYLDFSSNVDLGASFTGISSQPLDTLDHEVVAPLAGGRNTRYYAKLSRLFFHAYV